MLRDSYLDWGGGRSGERSVGQRQHSRIWTLRDREYTGESQFPQPVGYCSVYSVADDRENSAALYWRRRGLVAHKVEHC